MNEYWKDPPLVLAPQPPLPPLPPMQPMQPMPPVQPVQPMPFHPPMHPSLQPEADFDNKQPLYEAPPILSETYGGGTMPMPHGAPAPSIVRVAGDAVKMGVGGALASGIQTGTSSLFTSGAASAAQAATAATTTNAFTSAAGMLGTTAVGSTAAAPMSAAVNLASLAVPTATAAPTLWATVAAALPYVAGALAVGGIGYTIWKYWNIPRPPTKEEFLRIIATDTEKLKQAVKIILEEGTQQDKCMLVSAMTFKDVLRIVQESKTVISKAALERLYLKTCGIDPYAAEKKQAEIARLQAMKRGAENYAAMKQAQLQYAMTRPSAVVPSAPSSASASESTVTSTVTSTRNPSFEQMVAQNAALLEKARNVQAAARAEVAVADMKGSRAGSVAAPVAPPSRSSMVHVQFGTGRRVSRATGQPYTFPSVQVAIEGDAPLAAELTREEAQSLHDQLMALLRK